MLYRQPVKHRAWYDTRFSRQWELTGYIARMWGGLFAYIAPPIPDNDRDHIHKW